MKSAISIIISQTIFFTVFNTAAFAESHDSGYTRTSESLTTYSCDSSAKAWANKLVTVAKKSAVYNAKAGYFTTTGGLVDTKNFLTKEVTRAFENAQNKTSQDGSIRLINFNGKVRFIVNGDMMPWEVTEAPWYRDQYPSGLSMNKRRLVIRSQVGGGLGADLDIKQHEFPMNELIQNGEINFDNLKRFIKQAKENRNNEISDHAGISSYDLPKNKKIGYIGLVPKHSDVIVDGIREDVKQFPKYLNCKGYNFVGYPSRSIAKVSSDPKEIIRRLMEDYKREGIDTVYLNAAAHGAENGIYFPVGGFLKYQILKPEQLAELFDEYPKMKFIVDTVACHAGGIAQMMENYRDRSGNKGRIVSFLQTKGTGLNQEGRISGTGSPPTPLSTYYNIFRIYGLHQDKKFGEAHLFADKHTKNLIPSDAESYVSSSMGGISTKGLLSVDKNVGTTR